MSTNNLFPSVVMILRHGEKPGTASSDKDGGPHLSVLGSARAAALPSLFTPDPTQPPSSGTQQLCCDLTGETASQFAGTYGTSGSPAGPARFPTPDFLFATANSTDSQRPVETITPIAQALGLHINDSFTDTHGHKGIKGLKDEILKQPQVYGGKVILIAWHHKTAPDVALALGVPATQLNGWTPWKPGVFDLIFFITWPNGQANLTVAYQQLLFGDSAQPVSVTPANSSPSC